MFMQLAHRAAAPAVEIQTRWAQLLAPQKALLVAHPPELELVLLLSLPSGQSNSRAATSDIKHVLNLKAELCMIYGKEQNYGYLDNPH
jgi:hypothetical protein